MKITSLALAVALAPYVANAFTPSSSFSAAMRTRRSSPLSPLCMVGGGMIDPPRDDVSPADSPKSSFTDDDDDDDDDDEEETALSSLDKAYEKSILEIHQKGYQEFGDDYMPDIKPRPAAYGWTDDELFPELAETGGSISATWKETETTAASDDAIATTGKTLSDSERDDNLVVLRRLTNDEIPWLTNADDTTGLTTAFADYDERWERDPWFGLNDRLGDAVQMGEDDEVERLNELIEKVGGAPPSLVEAAKKSPLGYVLASDVLAVPLTAARLESIVQAEEYETFLLESRERTKRQAIESKKDEKKTKDSKEHIIKALEKERDTLKESAESMFNNSRGAESAEDFKKKRNEARKEALEKYKDGKVPEDFFINRADTYGKVTDNFLTSYKRFIVDKFEDETIDPEVARIFEDDLGDGSLIGDDAVAATSGDDDDEEDYESKYADRPMSKAARARAEAMKNDGSGRPRLPGDTDVTWGELDPETVVNESGTATTGPLTVEVSSTYNSEQSDPPMRKHCFQYTVRITNDSTTDTVQLLSRRFEIQTVGSSLKDVVQGEGVTGRQPVLKPGEVFEYTSTAPLSVRPIGTTEIAARMRGEYRYCVLTEGQDKATDEQANSGQGEAGAELATFHFVFPEEQRVKPVRPTDDEDDEEDDDDDGPAMKTTVAKSPTKSADPSSESSSSSSTSSTAASSSSSGSPATSLPGDADMTSGDLSSDSSNDSSDTVTSDVRVVVTSTYRPERSDSSLDKHCFAYNVKITNESKTTDGEEGTSIQLVSRRFEIQTIGSANKDVVQGPGVTGRQPVLKPGESFEYTSTAPLSVRPIADKTKVLARMSGEYNFMRLGKDGTTPLSSTPLKAELGAFHFILQE